MQEGCFGLEKVISDLSIKIIIEHFKVSLSLSKNCVLKQRYSLESDKSSFIS